MWSTAIQQGNKENQRISYTPNFALNTSLSKDEASDEECDPGCNTQTVLHQIYDIVIANAFFPYEADYDNYPTKLFIYIMSSKWSSCLSHLENNRGEASIWVYRENDFGKQIWSMLPLHAALQKQAPLHVVSSLLKAYPAGAKERNDKRHLPIHIASNRYDPDDDVLCALIDAYPDSLFKKSENLNVTCYEKNCPKLYRLIESKDWKRVVKRIQSHPYEVKKWVMKRDKIGVVSRHLPVHAAILVNAPQIVIIKLVNEFPASVRCVDDEGMIPLQWVIKKKVVTIRKDDTDLVDILIKYMAEYSQGISTYELKQESRRVVDYDVNCTTLFKYIEVEDWSRVLEQVEKCPEEVETWVMKKGTCMIMWRCLPLHRAVMTNAPAYVIKALIDGYEEGTRCCDYEDMLPLEIAIRYKLLNIEVVNMLLNQLLKSCTLKDQEKIRDSL